MDSQEVQNDIKNKKTYTYLVSKANSFLLSSSTKSVKTYPKAFQLSKLNSIRNANSNNDTPPTDINQSPEPVMNILNNLDFVNDYFDIEKELEDEHQTEEWFNKITIDEIICFLLSGLIVGNGMIYYEIRTCGESCRTKYPHTYDKTIYFTLLMSSISVLIYLLVLIIKYYHYYKLNKCAKYIQIGDGFFDSDLWKNALADFILGIIHPNLLFKDLEVITGKNWNLKEVTYSINDFMIVVTLIRMFDWIRVVTMLTQFYCARADRVCKMMGLQLSFLFSIKCLLIHNTMEMQFFVTSIVITSLGYILKVIEGPVYKRESEVVPHSNDFSHLGSCIWYIFVTMTTVGYGDYTTSTLLGCITTFFIGLIGTVLVAFNINYFQSKTELNKGEKRALDLIQRLEARENMRKIAAKYFKSTMKYFVTKNKFLRGDVPNTNLIKKKLLNYAQKNYDNRMEFNSCLHQFQIEYNSSSEVDIIKKRIAELEMCFDISNEKINRIENMLEQLLKNDDQY